MKFKGRLISAIVALGLTVSSSVALVASAVNVRNPDGLPGITLDDARYIQDFIYGKVPSYSLYRMDFNTNNVVSMADVNDVMAYTLNCNPGNVDNSFYPTTTIESRQYRKHYSSSSSSTSYTSYTISATTPDATTMFDEMEELNPGCEMQTIIGDNDMVEDTSKGVVLLTIGTNNPAGSGFVIGDHVVATAAHCVVNRSNGAFKNVSINIVNSSGTITTTYTPTTIHVPELYLTATDSYKYDYALLYFPSVNLNRYGNFVLGVANNTFCIDNNNTVTVSGLPQSGFSNDGNNYTYRRYKATGNVTASGYDGYTIDYLADMIPGESGGPVYIEESEDCKTVVAINAYQTDAYNFGTRIMPEHLKFYYNNMYLA